MKIWLVVIFATIAVIPFSESRQSTNEKLRLTELSLVNLRSMVRTV